MVIKISLTHKYHSFLKMKTWLQICANGKCKI